jgi:hypothetical protein
MRALVSAFIVLFIAVAAPAFAAPALSYTANPAAYEVLRGNTVDLSATLRNLEDAPLYVNDLSITFGGAAASYLRSNPFFNFFNNVPGTFETTDPPFTGSLTELVVDPATPDGIYTVTVELVGGASPSLTDPVNNAIGAQTFTIIVGLSSAGPLTITTSSPLPTATAGIVYSQTLSAAGGFGPYSNWTITSGNLPPGLSLNSTTGIISGTPLAVTGVFNFGVAFSDATGVTGSGSLQLTVQPAAAVSSTLAAIGGFAQVAAGGGWKTTIALINLSTATVNGQINFYSDNGNALTLPLTFPQFGLSTSASSQTFTLIPNESLVIDSEAASSMSVGWAGVQASGPLSGYSIFQEQLPGAIESEGTASFDSSTSSSLTLPYDNTSGYRTGIALANQSASPVKVTAVLRDQNGAQLASAQVSLQAFGHASFFLDELSSVSRNQLGVVQFQTGGPLSAVGLRFSPSDSFTSIPIVP